MANNDEKCIWAWAPALSVPTLMKISWSPWERGHVIVHCEIALYNQESLLAVAQGCFCETPLCSSFTESLITDAAEFRPAGLLLTAKILKSNFRLPLSFTSNASFLLLCSSFKQTLMYFPVNSLLTKSIFLYLCFVWQYLVRVVFKDIMTKCSQAVACVLLIGRWLPVVVDSDVRHH